MIEIEYFVQKQLATSEEWAAVCRVAEELHAHLQRPEVLAAVDQANQPGKSSAMVQDVFLDKALSMGFRDEAKGLFKHYANRGLRPDYYMPVERGKTNINNMDFLDFWKCHICVHADYLFEAGTPGARGSRRSSGRPGPSPPENGPSSDLTCPSRRSGWPAARWAGPPLYQYVRQAIGPLGAAGAIFGGRVPPRHGNFTVACTSARVSAESRLGGRRHASSRHAIASHAGAPPQGPARPLPAISGPRAHLRGRRRYGPAHGLAPDHRRPGFEARS